MAREKDTITASDEHNARGIELADRGWLDEAIKEFKRAIELDGNSAHAHDNLATVYAERKQYREALEEYLMALRLEPDSATAHYNLANSVAPKRLTSSARRLTVWSRRPAKITEW